MFDVLKTALLIGQRSRQEVMADTRELLARNRSVVLADDHLFHEVILLLFMLEDGEVLRTTLLSRFPTVDCSFSFELQGHHPFCFLWRGEGTSRQCFELNVGKLGSHLGIFVTRWLQIIGVIVHNASTTPLDGEVLLNIGDGGDGESLNFCFHEDFDLLIPDSDFLGSRGYEALRLHFTTETTPWRDKRDIALWRGSTTGRFTGGYLDLPRIRLCLLSQRNPEILDAKTTQIVQLSDDDHRAVSELGIAGDFIGPHDYAGYRYHVDIDGNSNAWSGLFNKLLSGGVVLKVESPFGYQQWYYDKLEPWRNVVPVRSDLSDLIGILETLKADEQRARTIADRGRDLALSLDYESQLAFASARVNAIAARTRDPRAEERTSPGGSQSR